MRADLVWMILVAINGYVLGVSSLGLTAGVPFAWAGVIFGALGLAGSFASLAERHKKDEH
jgi:hypothetical protein